MLFPPEWPSGSDKLLQPLNAEVESHYEGADVCVVTTHGSLSPGCGQAAFKRAAVDTRRAHAAQHHPLLA